MDWLNDIRLLTKDGEGVMASDVFQKHKTIGLYFSAHWCPPCRGFTPRLAEFYNKMKTDGKDLEIIFISSDRDEDSFLEYYKDMPWLALPFTERNLKARIAKFYKVSGIPKFMLFDSQTKDTICKDARSKVDSDACGDMFPWAERVFSEILCGQKLLKSGGGEVAGEDFAKLKHKALYFSAHWCPPCRHFTPNLIKLYELMNKVDKQLEILFVTADMNEDEFSKYFATMPWLALPFEPELPRDELTSLYEIHGIPTLIVLDEMNRVIVSEGVRAVELDPEGKSFPWQREKLLRLEDVDDILQSDKCLVWLTGDKDGAEKAKAAMLPLAEKYYKPFDYCGDQELYFIVDNGEGDMAANIRSYLKITDEHNPCLLWLDLVNGKFSVSDSVEVSSKVVEDFAAGIAAGTVESKQAP